MKNKCQGIQCQLVVGTFCNPTFEMNKYFYALQKENYSNFIDQLHCMFEMKNEGLWKANMNVKFKIDVQLLILFFCNIENECFSQYSWIYKMILFLN